ncbi:MAG: hypothetical protein SPE01_07055 [Candidatus Spyradocola sp.]|nr:hypothetical protein [Candidatus Spyradocola sp.]
MMLPRSVHNRVCYALMHTAALRRGSLQADARWLECIESTLAAASPERREFFELFFVQGLEPDEVLFRLYIERSTLYSWRDYFLWNVALRAAEAGLIHVRE